MRRKMHMKELFKGTCVALITPFKRGKIDYARLEDMIEFQVFAGTSAILILGTTGESPTVTYEERVSMMKFCKEKIDGRCLMLVGAGSNSTKTSIELCMTAESYGADGLLVVTPYYNKCNQEGLYEHYKEVAGSVKIPIIMYNVPSRTGVNIEPQTAEKLSHIKNIVGIKEANSDKNHIDEMIKSLCGKIAVYSGNDDLNYYFLERNASGIISVTANLFPELVNEMVDEFYAGHRESALTMHESLQGVNHAMFVDTNPIPVKYGASYLHLCENELRLPLTPLPVEKKGIVEKEIDKLIY